MTIRRRPRGIALAGAIALVCLVLPHGFVVARADGANQECTNNDDITVVVDFQNVDGTDNGVNVRCAPQPVTSGRSALTRANVTFDDYRGFVCRIAGLPKAGPCNTYPPANAYWVYWVAARGGEWCASNYGFDSRTPPPGSLEGWSFSLKKSSSKSPPPRYPVPSAIPGTTPHPLNGGDCSSEIGPPPPPTTAVPDSAQPDPLPTTMTTNALSPTETTRRGVSATTSTLSGAGVTASSTSSSVLALGALTSSSSIPYGDIDLSVSRGRPRKSSPWGLIGAAVGVILIGGLAVAEVLRRRDGFG